MSEEAETIVSIGGDGSVRTSIVRSEDTHTIDAITGNVVGGSTRTKKGSLQGPVEILTRAEFDRNAVTFIGSRIIGPYILYIKQQQKTEDLLRVVIAQQKFDMEKLKASIAEKQK